MATIIEKLTEIEGQLNKIPCLNGDECKLHNEIMDSLRFIEAMLKSNQIEFEDHRGAITTILEKHGVPCDDIKGWPKNNYEEKKNV